MVSRVVGILCSSKGAVVGNGGRELIAATQPTKRTALAGQIRLGVALSRACFGRRRSGNLMPKEMVATENAALAAVVAFALQWTAISRSTGTHEKNIGLVRKAERIDYPA